MRTSQRSLLTSVVALLAGAFVAPRATLTAQTITVERVVAIVGTRAITWTELLRDVQDKIQQKTPLPSDSVAVLRVVLNEMINEELLIQQASTYKIEIPDADVSTAVDGAIKRVRANFPTEAEFRKALGEFGTLEDYRRVLTTQYKRERIRSAVNDSLRRGGRVPNVAVSERDIQAYFDSLKANFVPRGPTITWRQIIYRVPASDSAHARARALADSLLAAVRAGADFDSVARRFSDDTSSAERGGDLDYQRRGKMVPEFDRWAFGLTVGQLSPVFQTEFGYHFLRVDRARPGEVRVRHVLIMPRRGASDLERAHFTMDSVATALRGGANFDSLAAKYNDNLREDRVLPDPYPVADLPPAYVAALQGVRPGEVTKIFDLPDPTGPLPKVAVVQLTTRNDTGEPQLEEYRHRIRAQLRNVMAERRLLEVLRRETFVEIRLEEKPAGGR